MKLKELRNLNGLSQTEMADLFGLKQGTYSNYENETTQPDIKLLIKIADYYQITLDYLVGRQFVNDVGFISDDEKELLNFYRTMNFDNKKILRVEARTLTLTEK